MTVPIACSPGRSSFGPKLSLSYDSGAGNGLFGLGWSLGIPSIRRKTERGLPRYLDASECDTFLLAGTEDLVPELSANGQLPPEETVRVYGHDYRIRRYRPRIEGLFARIERWTDANNPAEVFWRTISRDNISLASAQVTLADIGHAGRKGADSPLAFASLVPPDKVAVSVFGPLLDARMGLPPKVMATSSSIICRRPWQAGSGFRSSALLASGERPGVSHGKM